MYTVRIHNFSVICLPSYKINECSDLPEHHAEYILAGCITGFPIAKLIRADFNKWTAIKPDVSEHNPFFEVMTDFLTSSAHRCALASSLFGFVPTRFKQENTITMMLLIFSDTRIPRDVIPPSAEVVQLMTLSFESGLRTSLADF